MKRKEEKKPGGVRNECWSGERKEGRKGDREGGGRVRRYVGGWWEGGNLWLLVEKEALG